MTLKSLNFNSPIQTSIALSNVVINYLAITISTIKKHKRTIPRHLLLSRVKINNSTTVAGCSESLTSDNKTICKEKKHIPQAFIFINPIVSVLIHKNVNNTGKTDLKIDEKYGTLLENTSERHLKGKVVPLPEKKENNINF